MSRLRLLRLSRVAHSSLRTTSSEASSSRAARQITCFRMQSTRTQPAAAEEDRTDHGRWIPPDLPSRCTYKPGDDVTQSPHTRRERVPKRPKILPDVLHHVGETPLVRINKIGKSLGVNTEILAKCEYFSAGGSLKDRVAVRMIQDAEERGDLKPGATIIGPTSGNTGIGLALAGAVRGYRCIIVQPQRMSLEKVDVLEALGAEVVSYRTPSAAPIESPESHIGVSYRLAREIPGAVILDQYISASNPLCHYDGTAEEILDGCDGRLDMVICSTGTGGALTGIARKIKERLPHCKVIGVDPKGSIMAEPESLNDEGRETHFEIEGIGHKFIPTVCERTYVDKWYKVSDEESFLMARRLIREEGILGGGSCGAVMFAAIQAAKDFKLGPEHRCVILLPDSVRNYMWYGKEVSTLRLKSPARVTADVPIRDAIATMTTECLEQIPVADKKGCLVGVVTMAKMMSDVMRGTAKLDDKVEATMTNEFKTVHTESTLGELSRKLETHGAVFILKKNDTEDKLSGMATRSDLLTFVSNGAA